MKVNKKVFVSTMVLICLVLGTSWSLFNNYKHQPNYIVKVYMRAINNRDYVSAASLFYEDERLHTFNDEALIRFLSNYFEEKGFVRMEEGRGQIDEQLEDERKASYEVKYNFKQKNITSTLSVVKVEDEWKVVFPFRIEDVDIYTPLGSSVWFDDQLITNKEDNKYTVKNVLPGKYAVRIAFPNKIYNDYITDINVPTQTEIMIPYETIDVHVSTLAGGIVELGGEKKASYEGSVNFENVLEGTYPLKVYDTYGNIEPYEGDIVVSKEKKHFIVEDFKLSKMGNDRFNQSINDFYGAYVKGIEKHNGKILDEYVMPDNKEEIIGEFEDWFVAHKDIQNAHIKVEIEEVKVTPSGALETSVFETIDLINKEESNQDKMQNVNYKIVLKWRMTLRLDEEIYKLHDRILEESLVSYKDESGKWLAY